MASALRIALFSDVHANLPPLEAVLRDVDRHAPEEVWCAGDPVGYDPLPNEVLAALRERGVTPIRGNHDRAALGGDMAWFNELAAVAVRWTRILATAGSLNDMASLEDRVRVLTDSNPPGRRCPRFHLEQNSGLGRPIAGTAAVP